MDLDKLYLITSAIEDAVMEVDSSDLVIARDIYAVIETVLANLARFDYNDQCIDFVEFRLKRFIEYVISEGKITDKEAEIVSLTLTDYINPLRCNVPTSNALKFFNFLYNSAGMENFESFFMEHLTSDCIKDGIESLISFYQVITGERFINLLKYYLGYEFYMVMNENTDDITIRNDFIKLSSVANMLGLYTSQDKNKFLEDCRTYYLEGDIDE